MPSAVSSLTLQPSLTITPDRWPTAVARALHPASSGSIGQDVLATLAARLADHAVPWEFAADAVPTERRYARLLAAAALEAWLICWPRGASLELHDHGPSAGAFAPSCRVRWRRPPSVEGDRAQVGSAPARSCRSVGDTSTTWPTVSTCRPRACTSTHRQEGYASSLAVDQLARLGLTDVRDLEGGYAAWEASALPTRHWTGEPVTDGSPATSP